ncbi:MAG: CARDB domain-containing protein [Hyalangium sp.]
MSLLVASAMAAGCSRGSTGPAGLFLDTVVGAVTTSGKPDLWVSQVSGPASAPSGSGYFVTVTACNQGTGSADSLVRLYLSSDTSISSTDTLVGSVSTGSLRPQQCTTLNVQTRGPVHVADGLWYLGALIDPDNTVSEVSETNNARVGTRMAIGSGAELQVAQVSAPASLSPSSRFEASVQVCNPGTASASATVDVYLSADTALTAEDVWMGSGSTGSLREGQCTTLTISSKARAPRGQWYVAAWVDRANAVPELEENDNTRVGGRVIVEDGPDFTLAEVRAPSSLPSGASEPVEFTATVCNQGNVAASAQVEAYLSADSNLTSADLLVGSAPADSLEPGQCAPVGIRGSASVHSGLWYVAAKVVASGAVHELVESNNVRFGNRIAVGHAADLVVASVSGPASVGALHQVRATATVCNQGTSQSLATTVALFLSLDASITTADSLVSSAPVSELQAGECTPVELRGLAQVPDGAWYLGAYVDSENAVAELSENNNTRAGNVLGIGDVADLYVSSVSGPAYLRDTQSFTGQITVCNQGARTSNENARVGLFLSADESITASDTLLGDVSLPALAAGQCATVSVPVKAPVPEGNWYLGALADLYGGEPEFLEDNNARVGGSLAVGSTVAAFRAPVQSPSGASFTTSIAARN